MGDITTYWSPSDAQSDWRVAGGALQGGDDLTTATLISLFTDRQAQPDDILPNGDRRGWWGDPAMGSRLWLLARVKHRDEAARLAEEYAEEALAWMVSDGVVAAVSAAASWTSARTLALVVQLQRASGVTRSLAFSWAWDGLGASAPPPQVTPAGVLDFSDPANSGLIAVI